MAPPNCTAMYGTAQMALNTRRAVKASVTAGLMCRPESGPRA